MEFVPSLFSTGWDVLVEMTYWLVVGKVLSKSPISGWAHWLFEGAVSFALL